MKSELSQKLNSNMSKDEMVSLITSLLHADDREFAILLHTEIFDKLPLQNQQDILQELENRQAKLDGRKPYKVVIQYLEDPRLQGQCCYNENGENVLILNSQIFESKVRPAAPQVINTLLHEGRHAFQYESIFNDSDKVSFQQKVEWLAVLITYCEGDGDTFCLYAMQNIERDSRRFARKEMERINQYFTDLGIPDEYYEDLIYSDLASEERLIAEIRETFTLEMIEEYEKLVLNNLQLYLPDIPTEFLSIFDSIKFILTHDEITDITELFEILEVREMEKLENPEILDGKWLNKTNQFAAFRKEKL